MPAHASILVVDDNREVLTALRLLFQDDGATVHTATQPAAIPALLEDHTYDVAILDMNFTTGASDGAEGLRWLEHLRQWSPHTVVLMLTAYGDVDKAVAAMKAGASDFLLKPWSNAQLRQAVRTALQISQSRQAARGATQAEAAPTGDTEALLGQSPAMQEVLETIDRVAATDANVLILGEHGTGKGMIAQRLHQHSARHAQPFVAVDLGAVVESLFESELFGHEAGAFTGATHARKGPFEAASGGTLFLDEIGNIPMNLQNRLLTVLERRQVQRVGSLQAHPIDIRLVCATNQPIYALAHADPAQRPASGEVPRFRQDLLFRINTVEVQLPPLRARGEDVLLLARHFVQVFAHKYQRKVLGCTKAAEARLMGYHWPGNVRELRNTIERAVIMADAAYLDPADIRLAVPSATRHAEPDIDLDVMDLADMERSVIRKALSTYGGNISKAAEALGITRRSLYRRIEKHGL